jgi:hypothetical protein
MQLLIDLLDEFVFFLSIWILVGISILPPCFLVRDFPENNIPTIKDINQPFLCSNSNYDIFFFYNLCVTSPYPPSKGEFTEEFSH